MVRSKPTEFVLVHFPFRNFPRVAGATVKAYDGLGGSVSWAVGFGPEARGGSGGALGDAELGARGAELCPVRPDGRRGRIEIGRTEICG